MKTLLTILAFFNSLMLAYSQDFALGADISGCTVQEKHGEVLRDWQGRPAEATALMKQLGMNAVRLRVWVDPTAHGGLCDAEDTALKALRAKALGMDVMIDFHYSDWWADPAKQNIPKAWEKLSYKKMLAALREHTVSVLTLLKQKGVNIKWVQVGNETSRGLLWSVKTDPKTGWEIKDAEGNTTITQSMGHLDRNPKQYAGFIAEGYKAVKSVYPEAKVIVHLDNGYDNALYNRNLDVLRENGADFDIIGMSLYPYWAMKAGREPNAAVTIADCLRNIRAVTKKYDRDVMIVETGFEVDEQRPWLMHEGREQYAEILRRCREETGGRCKGVFYWEPTTLPGGYNLGAFGSDGKPTDIMRALQDDAVRQAIRAKAPLRGVGGADRPLVKIATTEGDIIVELYNETPRHRDNFLRLAREHLLDSTLFHRVIEGFMIQGGSTDSRDAAATSVEHPVETGLKDALTAEGDSSLAAEIVYPRFFHKRGALAAAREGDDVNPQFRSSASQFYIVWGKTDPIAGRHPYAPMLPYYKDYGSAGTPWLDKGYTVFGEVVAGLDVVERIQAAPRDKNDRPLRDVRLSLATLVK